MRTPASVSIAAFVACAVGCSADSHVSTSLQGNGTVIVNLVDAPFPTDSVVSVDVYVVRVDARVSDVDSSTANEDVADDSVAAGGWTTLAAPDAMVNLLALQQGTSWMMGQASLVPGTYRGFRLVIDPSKSSLTLANGQVLTSTSLPGVTFPSAARSGIKVTLAQPVVIGANDTTTMTVDFDVGSSFVMRGNSLTQNGLLFKPVVTATTK